MTIDDKIFFDLRLMFTDVTRKDIYQFLKSINVVNKDHFIFETQDGFFSIDKKENEFRILKRKDFASQKETLESDNTIMMLYKIAKRSGFKCYLETKYSN